MSGSSPNRMPSGMTAGALGFGRSWGSGLLAWPSDWQLFRWTKAPRLEAPTPCSPEAKGGSWAVSGGTL